VVILTQLLCCLSFRLSVWYLYHSDCNWDNKTSTFKQQFCLSHLWLIIFATKIAKTMLFHTTLHYTCNWDSIATVLKWQFCFYSVLTHL